MSHITCIHCHCHCSCTCTYCYNACNSCSIAISDASYGQLDPETIRTHMYKIKENIELSRTWAQKIVENIKKVSYYKQQDEIKISGPYTIPTVHNASISEIVEDKDNSVSYANDLLEVIRLQFNKIVQGGTFGTLPNDSEETSKQCAAEGTKIKFDFWDFLNNKIHIMRVYSNYFNMVICNACYSTCDASSHCVCSCICTCTKDTTASRCVTKTINPVCVTDGEL